MKTRRIGEQFDFEGVTLEVVKTHLVPGVCSDCYFSFEQSKKCYSKHRIRIAGSCHAVFRVDNEEVIFKEVES